MANNDSEGSRRLNRILQIAREEEDINRQLKALGMYDDSCTLEERKQILEAIKESEQLAAVHSPLITGRTQSRVVGIQLRKTNNSPSIANKKPFRIMSSDSENSDSADFEIEKTTFQPSRFGTSLENTDKNEFAVDPTSLKGKMNVKLPTNSYANKIYEAALKKNSTLKNVENLNGLLEQFNPPEPSDLKHKEVTEPLLDSDSSDEDPVCSKVQPLMPLVTDVSTSSTASDNPNKKSNALQIKKSKLVAMKSIARKYSKLLANVKKMKAEPLPETFDFNSTKSYQSLLAHEDSLRKAQLATSRPVKFSKLINLSLLNGKKLRATSKPQGIPNLSPLRPNMEIEALELDSMFDSPSISHKQQVNPMINSLDLPVPVPRSVSLEPLVNSDEDFEFDSDPKHIPKSFVGSEISRTKVDTNDFSDCPICSKPFPTNIIESHAAGCYNYLGDEPKENPPRSTRSSVRQNHGESARADVYVLPEGKARTMPVDEFDPYVIKYSDSDTEMEDSGPNKRSRRRDVSRGKKRRF